MRLHAPLRERFEEKAVPVPWSGCWLWVGSVAQGGYGSIRGDQARGFGNFRAHRISYELHKGPIPKGMCVCHACDVRSCVNPDHLFLATNEENTYDRSRKGRTARQRGEEQGASKLTWEIVAVVRESGAKQRDLAALFGVSEACISNVKNGKSWKGNVE